MPALLRMAASKEACFASCGATEAKQASRGCSERSTPSALRSKKSKEGEAIKRFATSLLRYIGLRPIYRSNDQKKSRTFLVLKKPIKQNLIPLIKFKKCLFGF
jgi:hypothetical protein